MTNYTKARKNYISEASRAISGHSTTHCVCKLLASQLEGEYQQKKMRNKCTAHLVTRAASSAYYDCCHNQIHYYFQIATCFIGWLTD